MYTKVFEEESFNVILGMKVNIVGNVLIISILFIFQIKLYRFWAFMDRTERHTNYPNFVRSSYLIHTLLVVFHWNGCVFHLVLKNDGFGSKNWVYSDSSSSDGKSTFQFL